MSDLRTRLLDAFQTIHERPIDYPQFGVTGVVLREFTARERQYANEATLLDAPADPDQILFRAMLLQRCMTDPATGTPYADGRLDSATGEQAIDPRTRKPVFTVDDVTELADSRAALFNTLWEDLLGVAALDSAAMFSRDHAPDGGERNARAGAQGTGAAADEIADQGAGDAGIGGAHADEPGTGDGQGDGAAG